MFDRDGCVLLVHFHDERHGESIGQEEGDCARRHGPRKPPVGGCASCGNTPRTVGWQRFCGRRKPDPFPAVFSTSTRPLHWRTAANERIVLHLHDVLLPIDPLARRRRGGELDAQNNGGGWQGVLLRSRSWSWCWSWCWSRNDGDHGGCRCFGCWSRETGCIEGAVARGHLLAHHRLVRRHRRFCIPVPFHKYLRPSIPANFCQMGGSGGRQAGPKVSEGLEMCWRRRQGQGRGRRRRGVHPAAHGATSCGDARIHGGLQLLCDVRHHFSQCGERRPLFRHKGDRGPTFFHGRQFFVAETLQMRSDAIHVHFFHFFFHVFTLFRSCREGPLLLLRVKKYPPMQNVVCLHPRHLVHIRPRMARRRMRRCVVKHGRLKRVQTVQIRKEINKNEKCCFWFARVKGARVCGLSYNNQTIGW